MHLTLASLLNFGSARFASSTVTTVRRDQLTSVTFAETAARVERLCRGLAARGVGRGAVVATVCRNHQEHLEVMFASHCLGACFTPLNNRVDDASLSAMIEVVAPAVLLVDVETTARLRSGALTTPASTRTVSVEPVPDWEAYPDLLDGAENLDLGAAHVEEDDLAALLFTGGTTGSPKASTYSQRELYLHAMAMSSQSGAPITRGDTILGLVPIFHGLGWQFPYQAWLSGANLAFVDGSLPGAKVIDTIEKTGATLANAVPTVWHDVAQVAQASERGCLGSLRTVLIGGAMIPPTLPRRLSALGITVYNSWGMTETLPVTMSLIASPDPAAAVEPDIRICRPIPGLEVRATDARGQVVSGSGQLEVRAPWISGRYFGQPEPDTTWFATGDIAEVGSPGELTILGRAKEVIKSGGEQIWPSTIEDALIRHPAVAEALVIEIPHERWGGQPLACLVLHNDASSTQLREFLLTTLPKWQVPDIWVILPELPHTSMGKVDRREVSRRYHSGELVPAPTSGAPR